jgi:uncharacterized repeat protein (TIGR03803 family)
MPHHNAISAVMLFAAAISPPVYTARAAALEKVLHTFAGGSDGASPIAGVTIGPGGNIYGTTFLGGTNDNGIVYKLSPKGEETVLYTFGTGTDAARPERGVIVDTAGNVYGTTPQGGTSFCNCGTVYKVTPRGKETVLYSFTSGTDGGVPFSTPSMDGAGNLYGTTVLYGDGDCLCGTVFKLTPAGQFTTVYAFKGGGTDGSYPGASVVLDAAGNLYGTTDSGGTGPCKKNKGGCGTAFKIDAEGHEIVMHSFQGRKNDGACPCGDLILDGAGNLYGVTAKGGTGSSGTVFRVAPDGAETILHDFLPDGTDGSSPKGRLALDAAGNLYGTTSFGPGTDCGGKGCGTVFKLTPDLNETILYAFADNDRDAAFPEAGVVLDRKGNLIGTAPFGNGANDGTVFRVRN